MSKIKPAKSCKSCATEALSAHWERSNYICPGIGRTDFETFQKMLFCAAVFEIVDAECICVSIVEHPSFVSRKMNKNSASFEI